MTEYNSLNVKVSNSKLNKLKSGIKNDTRVTIKLSLDVVGDSNIDTNFTQKLVLPNLQVSRLCKIFQMIHQLSKIG